MAAQDETASRQQFVQNLTVEIDKILNGDPVPEPADKKIGFILMLFPLGVENAGGTITTNGLSQVSVVHMLRTQADLLEPKN